MPILPTKRTPPSVDDPPFSSRPSSGKESGIRRVWEPPDPLPQQIYGLPRYLIQGAAPVDNPPFSSRPSRPNDAVAAWQPDPNFYYQRFWHHQEAAVVPRIDLPPGGIFSNLVTVQGPWQAAYYLQRPNFHQEAAFVPRADLPPGGIFSNLVVVQGPWGAGHYLQRPNFHQEAAFVPRIDLPPGGIFSNIVVVDRARHLPQLARKLAPGIPGVSVDPPPVRQFFQQPSLADPPPQPTLPSKYPQPFVAVTAQNPFVPPWLSSVIQAWQAGDVRAVVRQLLNPSFLAVPVNDPPFDRRHLEDFLRAWQPPDPLPTLPRGYYPQAGPAAQVDNPPGGFFQVPIWTDDLPFPILPRQLSPGIPGQSVDNPPTLVRQLFQPIEEVRFPILPVRFPQEAVVAAAQPFIQAWLSTVLQAWVERVPDLVRRLQLNPDLIAVPVNNPPFTMRGRTELANIVGQWPLEQWLIRQVLLNPDFLAVPENNPPFSHAGRKELAELIQAWQAAPYDFSLIQKMYQVVQEGPFVPPVTPSERFTVSGPSVQDLFGPIGDVSHNWGGGTQKRTV